eukprot:gene10662-12609_t
MTPEVEFPAGAKLTPAEFAAYLQGLKGSLHRTVFTNTKYWAPSVVGQIVATQVARADGTQLPAATLANGVTPQTGGMGTKASPSSAGLTVPYVSSTIRFEKMVKAEFTTAYVGAFAIALASLAGVPAGNIALGHSSPYTVSGERGVYVYSQVEFPAGAKLTPAEFAAYLQGLKGSLHRTVFTNTKYWAPSVVGQIVATQVARADGTQLPAATLANGVTPQTGGMGTKASPSSAGLTVPYVSSTIRFEKMVKAEFTTAYVGAFAIALASLAGVPAGNIALGHSSPYTVSGERGVYVYSQVEFPAGAKLTPAEFAAYLQGLKGSLHRTVFTNTKYWAPSVVGQIVATQGDLKGTQKERCSTCLQCSRKVEGPTLSTTGGEYNALWNQKPFDYHSCYKTAPMARAKKELLPPHSCFQFKKHHMDEDNRRELLGGKCETKQCQQLWALYGGYEVPKYTVCKEAVYSCHKKIGYYGECSVSMTPKTSSPKKCGTPLKIRQSES